MARAAPWLLLAFAMAAPLVAAAYSPLLAWRQPIYIAATFAGIAAFCLMLVQPLLAMAALPGLDRFRARRLHRHLGTALVAATVLHVAGLWITSPPDVIDVLLFRSPAPFSTWGALALWTLIAAATVALVRRRLRLRTWRIAHSTLVTATLAFTIAHAIPVQGTMEPTTKLALSTLTATALLAALLHLRPWSKRRPNP